MTDNKVPEFEPNLACISRIIKSAIPDNIQVTKDARLAFARAAGIFIFYLTHCSNDFSKENKRQTIYAIDVINALKELEFDELVGPVEEFLEVFKRETESKKNSKEKKDNVDMEEENEIHEINKVNEDVMEYDDDDVGIVDDDINES
eukprot:gene17216-22738_t